MNILKKKEVDTFVQCTCTSCNHNAEKYESLYICADADSNGKEVMVEIWDWRGKLSNSIFLYLDKRGVENLIKILKQEKKKLI